VGSPLGVDERRRRQVVFNTELQDVAAHRARAYFRVRIRRVILLVLAVVAFALRADEARDCEPKRDCTLAVKKCEQRRDTRDCTATTGTTPCVRKTDTRDCEPQWSCPNCDWFDVGCIGSRAACEVNRETYRRGCEAAKAAQNAAYAAEFAACREAAEKATTAEEIVKAREACEAERDAQNSLYAAEFAGGMRSRPARAV
jgi:hypothetical protein